MEHYFGHEKTYETTKNRKTLKWLLYTFKKGRRNYAKGKIYLKQLQLKDTFLAKRYGIRLLASTKEEDVC